MVARALELIPADSREAGWLWCQYGQVVTIDTGAYEATQEAFNLALTIAHRESDTALELRTLANAARIDGWHLRFRGARARSLRGVEISIMSMTLKRRSEFGCTLSSHWPLQVSCRPR